MNIYRPSKTARLNYPYLLDHGCHGIIQNPSFWLKIPHHAEAYRSACQNYLLYSCLPKGHDDLRKQTELQEKVGIPEQIDLFADFNGLPDEARSTEFYQHDANWTNRRFFGIACR